MGFILFMDFVASVQKIETGKEEMNQMQPHYYVQLIAQNYAKNLAAVPEPEKFQVCQKFLYGLDAKTFRQGFEALHGLLHSLYAAVEREPQSFGMPLKEIEDINAKSVDYTASNAALLRMPHLLLVVGAYGALTPNGVLEIKGDAFLAGVKELKITNAVPLLLKMEQFGLQIGGIEKSTKRVPPDTVITLTCPECRVLSAALKAMAQALLELNGGNLKRNRVYFYMVHPGLLEREKVKKPRLEVGSLLQALSPAKRELAAALHKNVVSAARPKVEIGGPGLMRNDWSCVYTSQKSKKVIMSLQVCQDQFSIKMNLQHIGDYVPLVKQQPERIQAFIRDGGWECGRCHEGCLGGFAFEMDGRQYNKCRGGSFVIEDIGAEDVPSCQALLERELLSEDGN